MAFTSKIGFLGAGKMATALAKGLVVSGVAGPKQIIAADVAEGARAAFAKEVGGTVSDSKPACHEVRQCHCAGREARSSGGAARRNQTKSSRRSICSFP
jgi:hypothetical protein